MLSPLRHWLKTIPTLHDPIELQQAPLVQVLVLGLLAVSLLGLPMTLFSDLTLEAKAISSSGIILGIVSFLVSLYLLRRGHFAPAIATVTLLTFVSVMVVMIPRGLNSLWTSFFLLALPIVFAGLLGRRWLLWLTIVLEAVMLALFGWLASAAPTLVGYDAPGGTLSLASLVTFLMIAGFMGLCFDRFGSALGEALRTALQREHELEGVRARQEGLIAERTCELRAALDTVGRREHELSRTLADLRESQEAMREISAPVLPVLPGVLVAPLVGSLDNARAEALTNNTLKAVEQQHARYVIFDITGVPVVDTHVAQVLIQTASSAQLLGARVLLVGVRPEVAQTMISLGIDLGSFTTFADLRGAIAAQLYQDGWAQAGQAAALN